jgi:hypothetical protein
MICGRAVEKFQAEYIPSMHLVYHKTELMDHNNDLSILFYSNQGNEFLFLFV